MNGSETVDTVEALKVIGALIGVGAVIGGLVVKVLDGWVANKRLNQDYATKLREELWEDNRTMRSEMTELKDNLDVWINRARTLETDVVIWKQKYELLEQKYESVRCELQLLRSQMHNGKAEGV